MDAACKAVVEKVKERAIKISETENFERLLDVATVSSNNKEIGDFVYDIMKEIGIYGAIEIKKSNNVKDRIEKVKGIKFSKGFYAPHFVNDLTKMQWRVRNAHIVLFDDVVRTMNDVMPYIQEAGGDPLLLVVNDVEPTILQTLINNKLMNPTGFNVMIVEHDGFGDRKTEIMNDIAAMTGATPCNGDVVGAMGYAEELMVDAESTSILGGAMEQELVDELIKTTQELLEREDLDDDTRLYYKRRLATLAGGVAVIHVGGATEVEMNEKKDRIEDAVEAVKAAIARGVVIGGGSLYLNVWCHYMLTPDCVTYHEGFTPVINSLLQPFGMLCSNAGLEPNKIMQQMIDDRFCKGYDVRTNEFIPIEEYRVYDPAGVLIDAITNAVAVAKSILSIERVCI
jgi:chaperonin GroEL